MSSNLQALDDFPSFTGEESPQEQIRQLQNYLFVVAEQLKYTMRNLGVENLNPKQWDSMKKETLKGQTQQDVFNKLFDGGKVQGFEIVDGKLYINGEFAVIYNLIASSIVSGVLSSADGTVKVDLGNNCVTIDGQRNSYKTQIKLSASGLQGFGENTEGKMERTMDILIGVGGLPSGIWNDAWEENTGLSFGTASGELSIGTSEASTHITGNEVTLGSYMGDWIVVTSTGVFIDAEKISIGGKTVSWKANGDGTYTLVGQ